MWAVQNRRASSSNKTRERHRIDVSEAPAMNRIFLARHCAGTKSLVSVWDVGGQVVPLPVGDRVLVQPWTLERRERRGGGRDSTSRTGRRRYRCRTVGTYTEVSSLYMYGAPVFHSRQALTPLATRQRRLLSPYKVSLPVPLPVSRRCRYAPADARPPFTRTPMPLPCHRSARASPRDWCNRRCNLWATSDPQRAGVQPRRRTTGTPVWQSWARHAMEPQAH